MSYELGATLISQLNSDLPQTGDYISEGDDHLRVIKTVLKHTFPTATQPLTATFDTLNAIEQTLTLGAETDTTGEVVKTVTFKDVRLKGGHAAKDPDDFVTLAHFTNVNRGILDAIYPVGAYWITEGNQDPATQLGIGQWERVSGAIFGVGPGVVGGRAFTAGVSQGNVQAKLGVPNIPNMSIDLAASGAIATTEGSTHSHNLENIWANVSGDGQHTGQGSNPHQFLTARTGTNGSEHTHKLQGTLNIGGTAEAFDILPPLRTANIWRRRA